MAGKNNSSIDSRISDLISRIDTLVDKLDNSKKESASSSKPKTSQERLTEDLEKKKEAEKQLEFSKQLAASEKERQEIEAKLLSSKLQQIEVELELSRINGATEEQLNVIIERYKEARVKIEEYNESIIFTAESTEIGKNFANNLANSVGLVETKTAKAAKALLSPKGLNNALSGFGKQAKNLVKPLNVAANLFDQFYQNSVKLVKSIDKNSSQARKTFGEFGNEISRQAIKNEGSLRRFNMSMDESFNIQTTMANTLAIYRKASDEQIRSLGYQIALQEKLGVSVEESATTFENLTTTMGHTPEAAQNITRSFLAMSNKTKIPLQLVNKVFNENNKQLLMFGKNANSTAMQLAYLEGNAKLNSGTLADMGDRFMKFEEASKSVSGLNNVLGGTYLSIDEIQQLGDDPVEIMKRFGGAIEASGRSIDEFLESPQMVAAAAEELGTPVEEFRKQLKAFQRGELDAAQASASLALQTNLTTEEMEKQAKATMSISENIEAGWSRISIGSTLANGIYQFVHGLSVSFAEMPVSIVSASAAINGLINKYRAMRAVASAGSTAASIAGTAGTAASTAASIAGSAGTAASTAAGLAGSAGTAASTAAGLAGSAGSTAAGLAGSAGTAVAQNPGMVDAVVKATGLGADEAAKFIDEGIEVAGKVGQSSSDLVEAMTTNATGPAAAGIYEKGAKALRFIRNLPVIRQVMNFSQGVAAKLGANLPFLGSVLSAGSAVFRWSNDDYKGALLDFAAAAAVGTGHSEAAIPLNLANLIMDFTSFDEGLKNLMFGPPKKKYAAGTGGFVQGKTNAIIGESGPEMVLPMNKMGAFLAEPIRAAIEQFALNSPTNLNSGEQNTPLNAKIEITLNGQVLKDFVLKTVGAELTPLV